MEIIAAILSAVIGGIITKLFDISDKEKSIKEVEKSFRKPVQVPSSDRRNSILLVGLGGSGKTVS